MSATWSSRLPEFQQQFERAEDAGLIAAARVGINETKKGLRGGYRSGAFVTGESVNSVTRSEPYADPEGGRAIRYGVPLQTKGGKGLMYVLFWELGHHNIFTRRFERKEVWRPTFFANRDRIRAAYTRVLQRVLAAFQANGGGSQ